MAAPFEPHHYVARHVSDIPRSGIREFFDIVRSMPDVISLGVGEPDFVTPWHIREAAIYALERGKTGYTSNLGLLKLREAIRTYVEREFGIAYDPKTQILVTVGVSEALDIALRAEVNPGDEVLYHEPCYVSSRYGTSTRRLTRQRRRCHVRPSVALPLRRRRLRRSPRRAAKCWF